MHELSELQRDGLGEIFNIGVGRAAASLSQIVNDEVMLSAPSVQLLQAQEAGTLLADFDPGKLSAVSQDFTGPFESRAILVFPESNALEIVRLMVGPHLTVEELSEFEQEAMCEIGNIILNACMSSLADLFRVSFSSTLPTHRYGRAGNLDCFEKSPEGVILVLQVDMTVQQRRIQGHIVFLLSVASMSSLLELLDRFLAEQGLT